MGWLIPQGISDFRELVEFRSSKGEALLFVDKTLLLEELLDSGSKVQVITRPRRFGKTLNLSMLRYFLTDKVYGKPTKHLFNGLKISHNKNFCTQYQGKSPVIFITFKDIKDATFKEMLDSIAYQITIAYQEHQYLLKSNKLSPNEKKQFTSLLEGTVSLKLLNKSIHKLTEFLHREFDVTPYLLIDEYDTPIHAAYINGHYKETIGFFRSLLGAALKDNSHIAKAILTGITRVSKESLFSGVNNLKMRSLFDTQCASHFGFTEDEINNLFACAKVDFDVDRIKDWYNGYKCGDIVLYNPWSIMECLEQKGKLKSYWVNTSGNEIIEDLIIKSDARTKATLTALIAGKAVKELVDEHIVFANLKRNQASIWSLLLMAGYLKSVQSIPQGSRYLCELKIPNKEIEDFYVTVVRDWLNADSAHNLQQDLIDSLLNFDIEAFSDNLTEIVDNVLSFRDVTKKNQEAFYHGLTLGIVACIHETHEVQSNKESGTGFYDLAIIPKNLTQPGIIIELKASSVASKLKLDAKRALMQINKKQYAKILKARGVKKIYKMGIAFSGKKVFVVASKK